MKKKLFNKTSLIISFVAVVIIATVLVVSGSAKENTINFALEAPATTVTAGEQFTVLFKATTQEIADFKLAGIQAEFDFDPSCFVVKNVTSLLGDDVLDTYKTSGSNVKYICVYDFETDDKGFESLGSVLQITLEATKNVSSVAKEISVDDITVYLGDSKANPIGSKVEITPLGDEPIIIPGDVNNDGIVNTADAIYLLYNRMIGESSYPVNQSTDFDGDGYIGNSDDAVYLLYHVIFGAEKYPLN